MASNPPGDPEALLAAIRAFVAERVLPNFADWSPGPPP